jgi:hypothetical protein
MKICINCQKEYQPSDNRQKYCSCSCASTVNNKLYPKKIKKENKCACGEKRYKYAKMCRKCADFSKINRRGNVPVEQAKTSKGPSIHAFTRAHAKSMMSFYDIPKTCVVCAYDRYVEICHIRPISDFPGETVLSVVNSLNNLVHLCPNHHKEFDRNLIESEKREVILKGSEHLKLELKTRT